jgi:hypothetical protein
MRKLTYAEKLLDPKWKAKRVEILERDKYKCQGCGKRDTLLDIHHQYYCSNREPWDYPNWNFVPLCRQCHVEWGKNRSTFETVFDFLDECPSAFVISFAHLMSKFKGKEQWHIFGEIIGTLAEKHKNQVEEL